MTAFLGPLDAASRVPPLQQTRVASFLISAHGALARQLAMSLPGQFKAGWQTELNAQFHREAEILSLLMRATSWVPDFTLPYQMLTWEAAWLPKPVTGVSDQKLAMTIDVAALGHAVHGVTERGDVDGHRQFLVAYPRHRLGQPGCLPGQHLVGKREIRHPACRSHEQREDLRLAVKLRVQFGLPAGLELAGQRHGKLSRQRAMRGNQERGNARLLQRWHAGSGIERAQKRGHGAAPRTGIARK